MLISLLHLPDFPLTISMDFDNKTFKFGGVKAQNMSCHCDDQYHIAASLLRGPRISHSSLRHLARFLSLSWPVSKQLGRTQRPNSKKSFTHCSLCNYPNPINLLGMFAMACSHVSEKNEK